MTRFSVLRAFGAEHAGASHAAGPDLAVSKLSRESPTCREGFGSLRAKESASSEGLRKREYVGRLCRLKRGYLCPAAQGGTLWLRWGLADQLGSVPARRHLLE